MRVVVIGGGAAGFFAALSAKEHHPGSEVVLLEKSSKLLSKVRVSGGGRCNVTHDMREPRRLARNYPRGERFLRKAFSQWCVNETISWFSDRSVRLKAEQDGRMFPITDSSQTIIDTLVGEAQRSEVRIIMNAAVVKLEREGHGFKIFMNGSESMHVDRVIVACGGNPKAVGYHWLERLGHSIVQPVPSLFTFNLNEPLKDLMGVVADGVRVGISGIGLEAEGPLLITHWGFSGPAVLRLSALTARELNALDYRYTIRVNWLAQNEDDARSLLVQLWAAHPRKRVENNCPFALPQRLWEHLLYKAGVPSGAISGDVGKRDRNRVIDLLVNDRYEASGKTTFKEEFVTAGGVDLGQVDPDTMRSKVVPGLYFAGEVLDIDGITGGFNFQAAWTTGWIAGRLAD